MDVAARYGGEEFVIIFPETDADKALIAMEKLRKCIEAIVIPYADEKLHVTISTGLAAYPQHAQEKDDLIKSADGALYVSKREGKNRISIGEKIERL
jgi:diguanylate cyclase